MKRTGAKVIGVFIDAISWDECIDRILTWAAERQPRIVCLCNVHSAVTANDDPRLFSALACSDMVLPDGSPVAWTLRRAGWSSQPRIAGPDLMERLCQSAQAAGSKVFFFGSSESTLNRLSTNLKKKFPKLCVVGELSPLYGSWSPSEEEAYIRAINSSGAHLIFVGLGCPKQEIWMAKARDKVAGVMLGVGAGFDFHAGVVPRAPAFMQKVGLEWLYRLVREPRRLWRRYLYTNIQFVVRSGRELLKPLR